MDIMELGAIGELVGGVAVIGSLLYVGFQVRQSTALARATAQRDINATFQRAVDGLRMDRKLFQRGCADFEALNREEQLGFDLMIVPMVNHLDEVIRMHQHNLETTDYVDSYANVCLGVLQAPGARYWWNQTKSFQPTEARSFLESRFADPPSLPPAFVDVLPWHRPDAEA